MYMGTHNNIFFLCAIGTFVFFTFLLRWSAFVLSPETPRKYMRRMIQL